jgi:hypothetical protein
MICPHDEQNIVFGRTAAPQKRQCVGMGRILVVA